MSHWDKIEKAAWMEVIMQEEGQTDSPFWIAGEEDNSDLQDKTKAEQHGSASPGLSYEKYMEKLTILNEEWKDKVPDDMIMRRDEIRNVKYVYIGCTVLYLLMTVSDGDASPISPLQEQIWPLVIVALLAPLQYLVSRQYREVRWHAEEMTAVIYRKGIFGETSCYVASATKFERGDELVLNSETHAWTNSDGGHENSTQHWIQVHRDKQQCDTFARDWNNQHHLLATIDFLRQKISQ